MLRLFQKVNQVSQARISSVLRRNLTPVIAANSRFTFTIQTAAISTQARLQNNTNALIEAVQQKDYVNITRIAQQTPQMIIHQTSNDNTALHEAAKRGDVAMIETLAKEFSANFNVNHKCHCYKQRTPLHYAIEGAHIEAVEKLLSLGANPDITDEYGYTSLDYAVKGIKSGLRTKEFEKIGEKLLQKNCKALKFSTEEVEKLFLGVNATRFFEKYQIGAKEKVLVEQQKFLDVRKRLPGKFS